MALRVFRLPGAIPENLRGLVLCVGNFDGVHRGHHRIFQRVIREAKRRGVAPAVLTFDPHPGKVLRPGHGPELLTPLEAKLALLESAGLEAVFVLRFNRRLSRFTPRRFVEDFLVDRLSVSAVFVGTNFRFGYEQAGNPALLRKLAGEFGFRVGVVPPMVLGGRPISSTRIRGLIHKGDVRSAARLLGRPYELAGRVLRGAGRGARLGFPTVNSLPEQECLPARGVYVTETLLAGKLRPSVTNFGVRPTFGGRRLVLESHLLNFSGRARPARMAVRLLHRLRDERKFPSPEALQKQIARDTERARRYFARRKASKK